MEDVCDKDTAGLCFFGIFRFFGNFVTFKGKTNGELKIKNKNLHPFSCNFKCFNVYL